MSASRRSKTKRAEVEEEVEEMKKIEKPEIVFTKTAEKFDESLTSSPP